MTTETEPVLGLSEPTRRRSWLAHRMMQLATRIDWAEPELRGLAAIVRPGDVALDVGAAHGMYTVPLAHLVGPNGQVHSFEPHPRQQGQLRFLRSLLGAAQVTVVPGAVGSNQGEHTMRLPVKFGFPIYGHAHIVVGTDPPVDRSVKVKYWRTPMHTVDDWVAERGLSGVGFLKVDVEGFEPNVITGAEETIDRWRPSLLLEIEERHLGRYGRDANQFADEIRKRWPDYRMYTWRDETWAPTEGVTADIRNYLFATDAALARAH